MLVLGVCSLKGGVGKTSVTLGLASAAMVRGLRTLVIDLDPQGDSTMSLAPAPPDEERRLDVAAVLTRPSFDTVQRAIAPSSWVESGLDVMMGSAASAEHDGPEVAARESGHLSEALSMVGQYDVVLVDCPPSLGGITRAGLAACDRVAVVTEPGLYSVMAVGRAMRAVDDVRRSIGATTPQPLGIVVNRVRARSIEQSYRLEELAHLYGPLVLAPHIPERAALQQAQGAAMAVHDWPGRAAHQIAQVFDELLARALRAPKVR